MTQPLSLSLAGHLVVLLAISTTAQGQKFAISPAGCEHFGGNTNNTYPFRGPASRYQQIHDAVDLTVLNGRNPLLINGMSFRASLTRTIAARSWELQVSLGHTTVGSQAMTNAFASNFTATPTQVLPYTRVNVVGGRGITTTGPNPPLWNIPFKSLFIYLPARGNLCWEWQHRNSTGTSGTYMDACSRSFRRGPEVGLSYGAGCTANGQTSPAKAVFSPNGANFDLSLTNAAANSTAIAWVGFTRTQVNLPGWCAPLYVQPLVRVTGTTDATGSWKVGSASAASLRITPYFEIYTQFGFVDGSLPAGVGLSDCGVLAGPGNGGSYVSRLWYNGNTTQTTGSIGRGFGLVTMFKIL